MNLLDARHLVCPEPTFQTKLKLRHMNDGDKISVKVVSMGCVKDLERMCLFLDHTHVETIDAQSFKVVVIRKGKS